MTKQELNKLSRDEYYSYIESKGHVLKRYEGEIDIWVMDADYHNGPGCEKCLRSWCHHCHETVKECEGE
jgi:hypothetical protein